ncbi:MAG: nucleotidyltransferase domain-containing protein [Eubacteriales bacterium]|nr:nucleotidyltransferase domain-containing protein [Eubacteriales bacterium]
METLQRILYNRNPMLILSYLSKNSGARNISSHIAKELDLSVGSVHQILKDFESQGLVDSTRYGKTIVYDIDRKSPLIKAFRVFDNLVKMDPLFLSIKEISRKIVLFGSCARGEDDYNSDIDILVITDPDNKERVFDTISGYKSEREIRSIVLDTVELMEMESNDRVFYDEIMKGIEVWEGLNGNH